MIDRTAPETKTLGGLIKSGTKGRTKKRPGHDDPRERAETSAHCRQKV